MRFLGRLLLLCLIASLIVACASVPAGPAVHHITDTPAALQPTAVFLDWLAPIGVLGLIAGICLFFFAPEEHQYSLPLVGAGGITFGVAMVLRVSLWAWPILGCTAAGAIVIGTGIYLYEKYKKPANTLPLTKA